MGASLERLQQWADESGTATFLLDPDYLEQHVDTANPIVNDPSVTPIEPYEYIYDGYKSGSA